MVDQLLFIDKPAGMTSHDVVDRVRGIFHTRRVGHAGTLDPFATGLLIVGVGQATKKLTGLVGLDKTYEATLRLGATSTTFDPEGIITEIAVAHAMHPGSPEPGAWTSASSVEPHRPLRHDIETALDKFRGGYLQKAPVYSAKKIKGQPLYRLARRGEATEELRPSKQIIISELIVQDYEWPTLRLIVTCSSGTYIRSLADDIGRELGCGAYLTELRRTRIGDFSIKNTVSLEHLASQNIDQDGRVGPPLHPTSHPPAS